MVMNRVPWKLLFVVFGLLLQAPSLIQAASSSSLYAGDDVHDVIVIDKRSDFDRILKSDGIWMVQFFAPWCGHCQQLVGEYKKLAMLYKGIVNVAAMDATSTTGKGIASRYNVQGFPSLFVFGIDKTKPQPYQGGRDAQSMAQHLANTIVQVVHERDNVGTGGSSSSSKGRPSKVVSLTEANFNEQVLENPLVSMVAFIAPWCGHCQRLLPEWEQAALQLEGQGAFLGLVDATDQEGLAKRFGIQGFPTIKVFPGGLQRKSDYYDYPGERSATAIVQFVLDEVDRSGIPNEIPELVSQQVLEDECKGPNRICVLAALPHILDSRLTGRNKYRDMLANVQTSFRGSAFHFLWFEGGSQPQLEEALEMTFGFPAIVALSLDRQAYAVHRGSSSKKAISSFLHSVTTGRQATVKLRSEIAIVTVEPWDGQDGAPVDDEIPLSEIMGEDDEL